MSKRRTNRPGRARVRNRSAAQVLDRRDEVNIAEFFHAHASPLMPLRKLRSECRLNLNDLLAGASQTLIAKVARLDSLTP
jgi:hypothetical protein